MRKTLREYLDQYAAEHTQLGTKLTHLVGIPMIVASLPLLPLAPPVGGAMFVGGWILQLIGHYVFEKHNPSFFNDPFYLLVGPIWVAIEVAQMLGIHIPVGTPSEARA
ncbi:MAG TPA: DUF962 domain-containing protein [Polyangia bacterium]|jgi:uncharacterized membrane protein YGL010W|nr:DUF962 domain-containing protein [Polyangia bacterium]